MNKLYYGDNLDILKLLTKQYPQGFIDLIYIDPPFNSARNYNMLFEDLVAEAVDGKHTALKEAFSDTWSNVSLSHELEEIKGYADMPLLYDFLHGNRKIFTEAQMSYLIMMAHRLYYMHKLLKDTGSLCLHCDPTMSHYLKILLDIIFELKNFQNEIIWQRTNAHSDAKKRFTKVSDTIFFYSKSENYFFKPLYTELDEKYIKDFYKHNDNDGKGIYRLGDLSKPSPTSGYNYNYKGYAPPKNGWRCPPETMQKWDEKGLIYFPKQKTGRLAFKRYLSNSKGKLLGNVWADIPNAQGQQRLGYPTQKPEKLLERIITSLSDEGSLVADFFCGCGTTVTVAERLGRKWLGVDINHLAISLIEEKRLKPLKANYEVIGFPRDIASAEKLARDNKDKFERWLVEYVLQGHKTKATGDGGIDGHVVYNMGDKKVRAVIEIKGGNVTIAQIRAFKDSIGKFNADFGVFVGFDKYFTKGMYSEADDLGFIDIKTSLFHFGHIKKMYLITVEEILAGAMPQELVLLSQNITY
ncbi:MAG: restriction endonuclease [Spirochaetaceae bacterium]|nr:restriction endonuclease [Spirochaetaceae bacterium]